MEGRVGGGGGHFEVWGYGVVLGFVSFFWV